MLTLHCGSPLTRFEVEDPATAALPQDVVWIDLENASPEEAGFVIRNTGVRIPDQEALSAIESSSRLSMENGTIYLSTPALYGVASGHPMASPLGLILSKDRLVTVRFAHLPAVVAFEEQLATGGACHPSSVGVFVGLVDTFVDRAADVLERTGNDLDHVSHRIFRDQAPKAEKAHAAKREDLELRALLRQLGQIGDLTSKIRDSLLGLARIVPYVATMTETWAAEEMRGRLKTLRQDITSLTDYDAHLANKIQFLLDATLGLINIEQNNIIKVLTVVSVVGVPPTFLASMYGMNFKTMPELDWSWGYPYALVLMVISAIGPYIWFRIRGWL